MEPHISQTREVSYANDDDDGDENDNDDHDAAAAPPPPPMLLLLMMMMMMMLIMFNITTAFEHRCRSGPLNIRTDVYTCTSNKHNRLQFNPLPLRYVFSRI
ncbi:hypothetical protein DPMN_095738 [Dreissena polymorpha]|uniref:Uncharacterized protein n=1 Tax=Dreissena polymorpha TaxID=45954 RepID=A0A9D4R323_DREPO|nr:hypothetical protein DPMN_095738 [Dreissena polymorpha]